MEESVSDKEDIIDKPLEVDTDIGTTSLVQDFKKPFVGPNKSLHKFTKRNKKEPDVEPDITPPIVEPFDTPNEPKEKLIPIKYEEPEWSGLPSKHYSFEVLKSGQILQQIDLSKKSFYLFGRLTNCDVVMAHPTVSRHHAVLQYKAKAKEEDKYGPGFYIYDLGSTHGTFLNKVQVPVKKYIRVKVGHMIKIGLSTRMFILQGPEEDEEEESKETVTELIEARKRKEKKILKEDMDWDEKDNSKEAIEEQKHKNKDEAEGIDWGMGEDADEETDLSENPYAVSQNEELYINDPKKTLRGWFEREGYELLYDCQEKGFAHFICRVELPIDNASGAPIVAEAIVKGKKKEAVVQCALEACRILDQHGLLRQAKHESRKRKTKNWEENDFYDSDEDTFLDRTGTVEKKRQNRMKHAGLDQNQEVYTYSSLLEKHKNIVLELRSVESEIKKIETQTTKTKEMKSEAGEEEDDLDKYMLDLESSSSSSGKQVKELKVQLITLKEDEVRIRKLANIAKPPGTPDVKPPYDATDFKDKKHLPLFGKRLGLKKFLKKDSVKLQVEEKEYESDSD